MHQLNDANEGVGYESQHVVMVAVGDKATIQEELKGLGIPVKNLDEDGYDIQ